MKLPLPSGLTGIARRLKAHDLQRVQDQAEDDVDSTTASSIVHGCWEETTDAGPYHRILTPGDTRPPWTRLLKGDLIGILFGVRVGSFREGEIYDFVWACEKCEKRNDWTIDLRTEVLDRIKLLPEASKEHVATGTPLTVRMYDNTLVLFRLNTVESERPFIKLRKQQIRKGMRTSPDVNAIDLVATQVVGVFSPPTGAGPHTEGLDGAPVGKEVPFEKNIQRIWDWVAQLDYEDLLDLQRDFQEADCGYHTDIKVKCVHCRWTQVTDVPLQKSFFVPRRRSKGPKKTAAQSPADSSSSSSSSPNSDTPTGSENGSTPSAGPSTAAADTHSPGSAS